MEGTYLSKELSFRLYRRQFEKKRSVADALTSLGVELEIEPVVASDVAARRVQTSMPLNKIKRKGIHMSVKEEKVKCPFCGKEFDTAMEMIQHDDAEHE